MHCRYYLNITTLHTISYIMYCYKNIEKQDLWGTGHRLFTCYDLGGGAADAIIVVICCGLWGRRHVGSGPWPGSRPGGARERPRVVERQRLGVQSIMRRSVRRGGSAWWRGLRLALGLVGLRRLRGRVARGVDAVFAGVASGGDGWVMGGAGCVGVTGLEGKGTGLFGRGWGLLLGAFRGEHNYHMILTILMVLNNQNRNVHSLTSPNHVWTRPPGSTLRVGGSYCKMEWTIPLGRGGGHELTGWAVEIQWIQVSIHQHVICASHLTRKCCIGARTHAYNL